MAPIEIPEPNEMGPGVSGGADIQALMQELLMEAGQDVVTPEQLAQEEAAAKEELGASSAAGDIIGALLGAAIGAAVDGKRGAVVGAGGAASQSLAQASEIEERLNRRLAEIRARAAKKNEIASKEKFNVKKLVIGEGLKDRRAAEANASRERAAVLSREGQTPFTEKDTEKIELGRVNLEELKRIRQRLNDVKDGDWISFIKQSLDPKSAAADVIADTETVVIGLATDKQKGTLTERDVAPFRKKAGLRAFKDKQSFTQALDKLIKEQASSLISFTKAAPIRNQNPTQYVDMVVSEAESMMNASSKTEPVEAKEVGGFRYKRYPDGRVTKEEIK